MYNFYAQRMLSLGAIIVIALVAVTLMLRGGKDRRRPSPIVVGYPADLFPARNLVANGPLAALVATQLRLVAIYHQLPAASDSAVWLRTFLLELREIMDTAYRVALVTRVYGQVPPLAPLIDEVQRLEHEIARQVAHRMLRHDADAQHELLDGRLATLRMCAHELASITQRWPPSPPS